MPDRRPSTQAAILRPLLRVRARDGALREIAVVGNAPLPPSALRARRIDGAALVVRMTTFAVDRAEESAGSRTDVVVLHRAVVPGPDTFRDHARRLYLLAEPGRRFWEPETIPPWWPADLELIPISNREFTSRTRDELRLAPGAVAWPTTGTLAVHLMHRLFPHARILLAGSSLVGGGPLGPRLEHEWGPAVRLTPEHRLRRERRLLHRWVDQGWLEPLP